MIVGERIQVVIEERKAIIGEVYDMHCEIV